MTHATAWTSVADPLATANGTCCAPGAGTRIAGSRSSNRPPVASTLEFNTLSTSRRRGTSGSCRSRPIMARPGPALSNADTADDVNLDGYPAIRRIGSRRLHGADRRRRGWVHKVLRPVRLSGPVHSRRLPLDVRLGRRTGTESSTTRTGTSTTSPLVRLVSDGSDPRCSRTSPTTADPGRLQC